MPLGAGIRIGSLVTSAVTAVFVALSAWMAASSGPVLRGAGEDGQQDRGERAQHQCEPQRLFDTVGGAHQRRTRPGRDPSGPQHREASTHHLHSPTTTGRGTLGE
jgi:hypothetical protein